MSCLLHLAEALKELRVLGKLLLPLLHDLFDVSESVAHYFYLHSEILVVDNRASQAGYLIQLWLNVMQAILLALHKDDDLSPQMNDLWAILVVICLSAAIIILRRQEAPRSIHQSHDFVNAF